MKLRTGEDVPEGLVIAVITALQVLKESNYYSFYDLVCLCRDPTYKLNKGWEQEIKEAGLLMDNNEVQQGVRAVVLAAVEGDKFDMSIVNPVAKE